MKNLFFFFLLVTALFSTTSCGNTDDDDGGGPDLGICTSTLYSERVLAALDAFNIAVTTYANDPSTANCEAYRNAAQDYLDVLREFETCTFLVNDADYQESLREAQQEVNDIEC